MADRANVADLENALTQPRFPPAAAVCIRNADVRIAGKALLDAVSTAFECGHITAILGPNGAGKSTLMSLLTGQRSPDPMHPDSSTMPGDVIWAGQPLAKQAPAQLARTRAFVAQESQVAFEFTVREIVELGRYPHRNQMAPDEACILDEVLHTTRTTHLQNQRVSTLSGGEKARVQLARALAQVARPTAAVARQGKSLAERWLLLDEPTAALDLQHQHQMLAAVQRWAATPATGAIAVLHDLNLALRYCRQCVLLDAGMVVASGPIGEVLTPMQIQQLWCVRATPVDMDEIPVATEPAQEIKEVSEFPKAFPTAYKMASSSQKRPKKVLQYLFEPMNTCTSSYQNDSD